MENPVVLEYCETIAEKMKANGLLGENREVPFLSEEDFCRYCEQMIVSRELEILQAEVMALEKLANRYQERFNIIGSVHKTFFEETPQGKEYKYLHIEQMLLAFGYAPMGFMDWLLERYCYMEFSNALPNYIEYLHTIGLEACYKNLAQELSRRLYSK
ncbi:MAG: hypothetical protein QM657_00195 [Lacrimispora sp.]|uniref:hypothetical protein n=1 Tax=Lacrimispora sp. TaxID=2719234 RepID=UPI0039E28616